ncbi:hypothetical protein PGTUg99_024469 [Puccinia graminis f. sp. tritici]|uniref:Uncharacterized protein n=1 Tax=Puccinia graminis f. sp. tritici TaxID=56615 RepID=A0A5B0NX35_PUCGR|nr:hypothetical protein PGTUg99_024469 [Puccinia graminis f. sp. tritici]
MVDGPLGAHVFEVGYKGGETGRCARRLIIKDQTSGLTDRTISGCFVHKATANADDRSQSNTYKQDGNHLKSHISVFQ